MLGGEGNPIVMALKPLGINFEISMYITISKESLSPLKPCCSQYIASRGDGEAGGRYASTLRRPGRLVM